MESNQSSLPMVGSDLSLMVPRTYLTSSYRRSILRNLNQLKKEYQNCLSDPKLLTDYQLKGYHNRRIDLCWRFGLNSEELIKHKIAIYERWYNWMDRKSLYLIPLIDDTRRKLKLFDIVILSQSYARNNTSFTDKHKITLSNYVKPTTVVLLGFTTSGNLLIKDLISGRAHWLNSFNTDKIRKIEKFQLTTKEMKNYNKILQEYGYTGD